MQHINQNINSIHNMQHQSHDHSHQHSDDGSLSHDSPPTKLFFGFLPRQVTENDLRPIFSEYGPVSEIIILKHRVTGLSKGCGFVNYLSGDDAAAAQHGLDGKIKFPHSTVAMSVTRPGRNSNKSNNSVVKLYVCNLHPDVTHQDLLQCFHLPDTTLIEVHLHKHKRNNSHSNDSHAPRSAFVKYATEREAKMVIDQFHDKHIRGISQPDGPLQVREATSAQERTGQSSRRPPSHFNSINSSNHSHINQHSNQMSNMHAMYSSNSMNSLGSNTNSHPSSSSVDKSRHGHSNYNLHPDNSIAPPLFSHQSLSSYASSLNVPPSNYYALPANNSISPFDQQQLHSLANYISASQMQSFNQPSLAGFPLNPSPMMHHHMPSAIPNNTSQPSQLFSNADPFLQQQQSVNHHFNAQKAPGFGNQNNSTNSPSGYTIHISNLSPRVLESDLVDLFAIYGRILSCNVVRNNGVSTGHAHMLFESYGAAVNACALNDSVMEGKQIQVTLQKAPSSSNSNPIQPPSRNLF